MDKLLRALPKHKSNDTYYWNINFTPHSLKLHDNGKLENIDGNYAYEITEEDIGIDNLNTHHIIAHGDDIYIVGFYTRVLYSTDVFGVLKYELDTEAKEASLYEIVYTEDSNILGFTYSSILDLEETNGLIKVYINLSEQSNNRISDGNTVYINIDTTISDNSSIIKESVLKKGLNSITVSQKSGGSLAVGDYRYAFRLIKKNGVVTKWSPISNNVVISRKYNEYYTGDLLSKVQDDGENYQERINSDSSAKLNFTVETIHLSSFDYIEILRIYTYDPEIEPVFEICKLMKIDADINDYKIRDTDNNDILDTLSLADFIVQTSNHAAGISKVFKQRKFDANILDKTVDTSKSVSGEPTLNGEPFWEGVPWNYTDPATDIIVELNGTYYYTNYTTFPSLRRQSDDVAVEYDPKTMDSVSAAAIKVGLSIGGGTLFRANADGDWGLEGPNIRITFVHSDNVDETGTQVTHDLATTECSNKKFDVVNTMQHNSIYRIALRFFDEYGNSYLRYVGDIITPPYDYNNTLNLVEDDSACLTKLKMVVNIIEPPSVFKKVQILYVKSEKTDRLVLSLGLGIPHTTTKRDTYLGSTMKDNRLLLTEEYDNTEHILQDTFRGCWSIFSPEHLIGNINFDQEKLEYRTLHEFDDLYSKFRTTPRVDTNEQVKVGNYGIYSPLSWYRLGYPIIELPTRESSAYYKSTDTLDGWSRAITYHYDPPLKGDARIPLDDSSVEVFRETETSSETLVSDLFFDSANFNIDKLDTEEIEPYSIAGKNLVVPLLLIRQTTFDTSSGISAAKEYMRLFEITNKFTCL